MKVAIGCVAENDFASLSLALRLKQSIDWFGGKLRNADFYICVIGQIPHHYNEIFKKLGVRIRLVNRLHAQPARSNLLRFFELPDLLVYDHALGLDTEVIITKDPFYSIFESDLSAKLVDLPVMDDGLIKNLTNVLPSANFSKRDNSLENDNPVQFVNTSVISLSNKAVRELVPIWRDFVQLLTNNIRLIGNSVSVCESLALGFALQESDCELITLGNEFNFPAHLCGFKKDLDITDVEPFVIRCLFKTDESGYINFVGLRSVDRSIAAFNEKLRKYREEEFDNRMFWNERYQKNPELGSGVGSRGEVLEYKKDLVGRIIGSIRPESVLDVGCGDLAVGVVIPGSKYTGVDSSDYVIEKHKETYPDRKFLTGDFVSLEISKYDLVIAFDVVIHIPNRSYYTDFVNKMVRTTKRFGLIAAEEEDLGIGGIVFFHEPISKTLCNAGAKEIIKIGQYRHTSVFLYSV